jgi:hypothetical protein
MPLALDAEGIFWLPILSALRSCGEGAAQLTLAGRAWSHSLTTGELADGDDLGVLVVPDTTLWKLLVLDHERKPLAGARVMVQDTLGSTNIWNHSTMGGRAEFLATPGTDNLVRITHEGHLPRYLRTGSTATTTGPIVVALERSAALEVRAVDASGRGLQGALRVRAPLTADPTRDWRDLSDLDPETLECERRWNAEYETNFGSVAVLHQGHASVHINGVARGIPLLVELLNSDGSVRTVATTSIPNDAWMQTVQLVWDENGYRISGFVRDEAGSAIAGAFVELGRTRAEFNTFAVSDAQGHYEFQTLSAPLVDKSLFVSKLGWAPVMTPVRNFGPQDDQHDFVLQRSRPLRVRLVDGQQRVVDHAAVRARFAAPHGELCLVRDFEPGTHRTSDVPQGFGTVDVQLAGTTQSFPLADGDTEVSVMLSNLGALQVSVAPILGSTLLGQEVEIHAQGSAPNVVLTAPCELRQDGSIEALLVHLPAGTWTVSLRARTRPGAAWVAHGVSSSVDIPMGVDLTVQFP